MNEKNIEELLKEIGSKDVPADVQKIAEETARDFSETLSNQPKHYVLWEYIMNSKMTKLAAAAVIVIAVMVAINFLDKSVTPAYAIEQTIEAMRAIHSVHAYCSDWDNSEGELWLQVNPETGQEEYYRSDQGNLLIVGTPQATYYYYKDKNLVRIRNGYVPTSDVRVSRFFEDLVGWIQQYHGKLSFYSQFDEGLQKEVIVVHGSIPTQGQMEEKEFVFRVDTQTKLPIDMEAIKCGPGEGIKSINRIEYNVTMPEGVFEFGIPNGAKVVYDEKG